MEDGHDLEEALRRVAGKHGINLRRARPPSEILQAAIREYRELFRPRQSLALQEQRGLALQAMAEFAEFRPKLIGALLQGDGPLDLIQLILTADSPELVMHHLADRHIPWQDTETMLTHSGGRRLAHPSLRFVAGESTVELVIIDSQDWSDPPRNPVDGGPLEMSGAAELSALVERNNI